ncbi:Hypothetical protein LUCI_1697 [Lucifera butyrica]|uniref:Uncharacterized protein n=1 Tax=Lucifera butyrica TaxID=1351585 RepID=A0A498R5T0_9FIRM|nr:hypothetical protein [Lucifera butyrica]VBB06465.1 Hypothetical protein LUCI_1697 [Lucifera butyrica]
MKNIVLKVRSDNAKHMIIGVDIAKELQRTRLVDYRGLELGKALKCRNGKNGSKDNKSNL